MAKAGDIALFRGEDDIIDDLIEFFTTPPYTHAAFYIDDHTVVEMWWSGIRLRDMTNETNYDVFTPKVALTKEQINNGIEYANNKLAIKTRYNFLALVGIAIEKITGYKHNIFYSRYNEICSELVSEIYNIAMGIDICPNIEDASTSPADIGLWDGLIKIENH